MIYLIFKKCHRLFFVFVLTFNDVPPTNFRPAIYESSASVGIKNVFYFLVKGFGAECSGLGFEVHGLGLGLRVQGSEFRIEGLGFRFQGSGFRVEDLGWRISG